MRLSGDCSGVTCQNDEFCHLNDDAEKDAECLKGRISVRI